MYNSTIYINDLSSKYFVLVKKKKLSNPKENSWGYTDEKSLKNSPTLLSSLSVTQIILGLWGSQDE